MVEKPTIQRDENRDSTDLTLEYGNLTDHELRPQHTYYTENGDEEPQLSESHHTYLLKRHGTVSLDPIPSADPADPYNWPAWKVSIKASALERRISDIYLRKTPIS
jgi:hypothetical protein